MKLTGRRKEVLATVISNLALQAVTALCGFVLPPMVVRAFGSEVNGMVSSITQFIAYLNLVEAGVGGAAIAALYRPLAEGNTGKVNGILSAVRNVYWKSGLVFTVGIIALAFAYPLIVRSGIDRTTATLMVLVLGIAGAAEFFLIGKYRVLLTAGKKLYVVSAVQAAGVAVNTAAAVILLRFGCGILTVKLVSGIVYLSRFVFLSAFVRRKYRDVCYHATPDMEEISQSRNAFVHQISGFIVFYSPVIILSVLCGLREVSVYSLYAMVFVAVGNITAAFCTGMQSFFGESLVRNGRDAVARQFSVYETAFFSVSFWVYSCAAVLIMPFMSLYTRDMTDINYMRPQLAAMFVASGVLTCMRQPGGQMISAAGHFRQTQWRSLAEAAIHIVAGILFTVRFGICGVVMGNVCSSLYRGIDVAVYTDRHLLGRKPVAGLTKFFLLMPGFALAAALCMKTGVPVRGYMGWVLYALAVGLVCAVPAVVVIVCLKVRRGSTDT